MGLKDRLVAALGGKIEKSPNLPAGSVTLTEQQMTMTTGGAIGQSYGNKIGRAHV